MAKIQLKPHEEEEFVRNYWLKLPHNTKVVNPFDFQTQEDKENPHVYLVKLFKDPNNFYITAKYILGIELLPYQLVILRELWNRKYPMLIASRGGAKSFLMALYIMLKCLFKQGTRVIIVGAGFRQSKMVFRYCEHIWNNAPVLRDIFSKRGNCGPKKNTDEWQMVLGESVIYALPIGDGSKIRGYRANIIVADEFRSMAIDIFENVISGFASTTADPVQEVKKRAIEDALKELGKWKQGEDEIGYTGNQEIISGTTSYHFEPFYKYWMKYKAVIESKGDINKLGEYFPNGVPAYFNWKDYSIIRIPFEKLPPGLIDEKHVAKHRATASTGNFNLEYGAVFEKDSEGFFRRSLIESAVCNPRNNVMLPSGPIIFTPSLGGSPHFQYVYGIDPASEVDNLSIIILEIRGDHRRVVYGWTTNKAIHRRKLIKGLITEKSYSSYCARKIRNLMKTFPPVRIAMDSQGGGFYIEEALHDESKLEPGERLIWPIRVDDDPKPTDGFPGMHILELANFSSQEYTNLANHGLKTDIGDKMLLFPYYDPAKLIIDEFVETGKVDVYADIDMEAKLYDTYENVIWEIEQLKDELSTIVLTRTPNGRDRWDTPEFKKADGKKGRLRKDRYSALLMANMSARQLISLVPKVEYPVIGGVAQDKDRQLNGRGGSQMYRGNETWANHPSMRAGTFGAVIRK